MYILIQLYIVFEWLNIVRIESMFFLFSFMQRGLFAIVSIECAMSMYKNLNGMPPKSLLKFTVKFFGEKMKINLFNVFTNSTYSKE